MPELVAKNPQLFWIEDLVEVPLARWAVPAFLMISGALLLDPGREFGPRKMGRYLWRMAFILLTIGYAFCVIETVATSSKAGGSFALTPPMLASSFLKLLEGKSWDHLWYLYALIGLYLLTPVLRPFVAQASRRELGATVLVAWTLMLLTPAVNLVLGIDLYPFLGADSSVVYYLAGYYAFNYLELDGRVVMVGLASLACACLPNVLGSPAAGTITLPQYGVVLPYATLVFLSFRRFLDTPIEGHRVWRGLARDSFGIYLLHPLFGHLVLWFMDVGMVPVTVLQLAIFVLDVVGAVLLTRLLRLLPCYRKKL